MTRTVLSAQECIQSPHDLAKAGEGYALPLGNVKRRAEGEAKFPEGKVYPSPALAMLSTPPAGTTCVRYVEYAVRRTKKSTPKECKRVEARRVDLIAEEPLHTAHTSSD